MSDGLLQADTEVAFLDARRLTGPNLLSDGPGSILDISCPPDKVEQIVATWEQAVDKACQVTGWEPNKASHQLSGGVSVCFSAPIDALYAASEINEWAWHCISAALEGVEVPSLDTEMLAQSRAEEANLRLLELQQSASEKDITFLWDDDDVSLGMGKHSETWPSTSLPAEASISWSHYHDIPVGIVTGTNGKTTTARLASHILKCAGYDVGMSCTDSLSVDGEIIDRGDWSGPGGARTILRQPKVSAAILETARGGLLRRGLGVEKAEAAVITNIAADHLGDFGSRNLNELLDIKWIVSRAVESEGALILNAEDKLLVENSANYQGKIVWFSLDPALPLISKHLEEGGSAFILQEGLLVRQTAHSQTQICSVPEIPITLDGAARHNIANALAAAALTFEMGLSLENIKAGLVSMSQDDNPGRTNVFDVKGFKVLVDFAHNPHAMGALFDLAAAIPATRRLLAFGQAGDRPDDLIRELTESAWCIGLDRVLVSELAHYHRGRAHGDVFSVIKAELINQGARPDQIAHFEEEMDALSNALGWARSGDLIIMLALDDREAIKNRLVELAQSSSPDSAVQGD